MDHAIGLATGMGWDGEFRVGMGWDGMEGYEQGEGEPAS